MSRYHTASGMCDAPIFKATGLRGIALRIARTTRIWFANAVRESRKVSRQFVYGMARNKRMGRPLISRLSKAIIIGLAMISVAAFTVSGAG